MDYYSLFWGPGLIFTIDEPDGALTCRSSTLAVLADSESFHGLLLTILANPGVCLCVDRQHSHFWPILAHFMDYYSPFSGPKAISMVVELQGALTCRSSTLTVWPILARFVDY